MHLIESGRIPRDESICVSITGNGMKTLEALRGQFTHAPVIEARLSEFEQVVASKGSGIPVAPLAV
jgi:threonine synthase